MGFLGFTDICIQWLELYTNIRRKYEYYALRYVVTRMTVETRETSFIGSVVAFDSSVCCERISGYPFWHNLG